MAPLRFPKNYRSPLERECPVCGAPAKTPCYVYERNIGWRHAREKEDAPMHLERKLNR